MQNIDKSGWGRAKQNNRASLNRVAETHFFVRIKLNQALDSVALTDASELIVGSKYRNYGEYWRASYGEAFFDIGTLLRLATAIEDGLREVYLQVAGEARLRAFVQRHGRGVFQRLRDRDGVLVKEFRLALDYELESNPEWSSLCLIMAHRHLYAHRSGQIDEDYVRQIRELSGEDVSETFDSAGWPAERMYWFRPLHSLGDMIEETRRFFDAMPT